MFVRTRPPVFTPLTLALALALACSGRNPLYVAPDSEGGSDGGTSTSTGDPGATTAPATSGDAGSSSGDAGVDTSAGTSAPTEDFPPSETTDGIPPGCFDVSDSVATTPPDIVFVLDKSGSMVLQTWDHDGVPNSPEITRWKSLHETVDSVLATIGGDARTGLVMFPGIDASNELDEACLMPPDLLLPDVDVDFGAHSDIMLALPGPESTPDDIQGGTPAAQGVAAARQHLVMQSSGQLQFIVLVTDGAANCSGSCPPGDTYCLYEEYDPELISEVDQALESGIVTMVVGVDIEDIDYPDDTEDGFPDGINPWEVLNEVALAGGLPSMGQTAFLEAKDQLTLQLHFSLIIDFLTPCHVVPTDMFPVPEGTPGELIIELDGEPVPELLNGECIGPAPEFGWTWLDETYSSVVLCGDACEAYKDEAEFDVLFCPDA